MSNFVPNKILKAGEVVFREGEYPEEGIFYICDGEVSVLRNEHGADRELATLAAGDIFGEMAIINSAPRNATVVAKTDCSFFTLNQAQFQHQVHQLDPVMRGAFRVFVLTIRDLIAQRDMMSAQLQSIMQQMQQVPVAGTVAGTENQGGSGNMLADGAVRVMKY